ncbi:VCBS repeat-containing protein [Reinekea forsetii]|nr:VCBS repeat-containing protein [Reinekea forsetii]
MPIYPSNRYISFLLLAILVFIMLACAEPPSDQEAAVEDSVDQTLTNLGVDTTVTDRQDDEGNPLPENYLPLGANESLEKFDELVLIGWPLAASSGFDSQLTLMEFDRNNDASFTTDVLFAPSQAQTPWASSVGDTPESKRHSVAADIDADGLQELIVVHQQENQAVQLMVYEDKPSGFIQNQTVTVSAQTHSYLSAGASDINGDGYSEVWVALISGSQVKLQLLDNTQGLLSLSTTQLDIEADFPGSEIQVTLSSGNIDYDASIELGVIVNESFQLSGDSGISNFYLFDDQQHNFEIVNSGLLHSTTLNRTAVVGNIVLADIDNDNIDEIVLAGLTHFDPDNSCEYSTLLLAYDDAANDFSELGALEETETIHGGCNKSVKGNLRYVHLNAGDIDGDGISEIQANEYLYDDFSNAPAFSYLRDVNSDIAKLPLAQLYGNNEGFTGEFAYETSDIIVADMTANKRQDVVFISHSTNEMQIWGMGDPKPNIGAIDGEWRLLKNIPITPVTDETPYRPDLLAINVNHDGLSIAFDAGEHKVVFTEPVILAALAAAPCYSSQGQNLDACRTSYGSTQSQQVEFEDSLSISAGVFIGVNVEFSDPITALRLSEVESKVKVTATASLKHSSSYTYSETVEYTTGSIEDTVVFSTIPFDIYTYTITSHPDENLMGEKIVVSMPRAPVTLQVSRDFYNANVEHGGPKIGTDVFNHKAGDPSSYPTASLKDSLLNRYSLIKSDEQEITRWAYATGPAAVGEGGGSTSLEINIVEENGTGTSVGAQVEFEAQATFGVVLAGFSVGSSVESSLQVTHGEESSYVGAVANLPSEGFADKDYRWGLMTYLVDDHISGQQFEVINYWVE